MQSAPIMSPVANKPAGSPLVAILPARAAPLKQVNGTAMKSMSLCIMV